MNLKRAVWVSVVAYLVSLIIGMGVMFLLGINPAETSEIPQDAFLINIIVTIIFAVLFTLLYFKDRKINANAKEGALFGVVLVIIGFILDVIVFSASSALTGTQQSIADYYANPLFWLAVFLLLITTTLVGTFKRKKR